jgi:hypothetical protein
MCDPTGPGDEVYSSAIPMHGSSNSMCVATIGRFRQNMVCEQFFEQGVRLALFRATQQ